MLFIKAFTSYFHIYRPPPPSAVASPHRPPSPIGLPQRRNTPPCENRRRAVSYVSTGLARLPRDTNASPIYRRRAVVYVNTSPGLHSLVAERRHSSVTRYAKRSVACRDSPRHQPLRAGGTPLPRYPSDCPHRPPSPIGLRHRRKTAEERFNMLARGWLAYPVTTTHHPSTAEERL